MSAYYYLEDPESNLCHIPIPEEEMLGAVLSIATRYGLNMTDKAILAEIQGEHIKSKKTKKKTNLYIDGTNLFAGQYELFGPGKHISFNFLIQEIKKLISIDDILFYASYMNRKNRAKIIRDRKKLITAEALFYREVRNTRGVTFYRGHRSPTSGKEKGVDVHLSVDIVKDIFFGNCNQIVIMTGDADLIYPIEIIKTLNIPTYAIFLPNRFSLEMAYKVNKAYVLSFSNKFNVDRRLPKQLKIASIKKPRMVNIRGR